MQKSKLKQLASEYYHYSPLSCWILGITSGALIAAIIAFDLFIPFASFLTVPFLIVPIYFATTIQHVMLKSQHQITVRSSFRTFILYFRRDFFGTFSIIFNFVKSVLVFLILETTISFIAQYIFVLLNPSFVASVESLYALITSYDFNYQDIINALEANNYLLLNYATIVMVPSYVLATIFFVYNLSRYSMIVYYKMHIGRADSRFAKLVYQFSLRGNRMSMLRNYLSLNWPLYLLLVLGSAGGAVFGYFFFHDILKTIAFSLLGGALLGMFFLPFYFSNQQALYDTCVPLYKDVTKQVTSSIIGNLQADIDLSEQEKERLEETLSNVDGPLNDEGEDENKKDPGGS